MIFLTRGVELSLETSLWLCLHSFLLRLLVWWRVFINEFYKVLTLLCQKLLLSLYCLPWLQKIVLERVQFYLSAKYFVGNFSVSSQNCDTFSNFTNVCSIDSLSVRHRSHIAYVLASIFRKDLFVAIIYILY